MISYERGLQLALLDVAILKPERKIWRPRLKGRIPLNLSIGSKPMSKRVLVVSARMGAGHDGAAREICRRLELSNIETKMVDFLDACPSVGRFLEDTYHFQLARAPWSYDLLYQLFLHNRAAKRFGTFLLGSLFERRIRNWAKEFDADGIVTTYPFTSVVLGRARKKRRNPLEIPVTTFLTDFSVHPMWVHDGVDRHVCISETTADQVRELTSSEVSVAGPFVSPAFFEPRVKREERIRFGLPTNKIVVLLVAGSWGVGDLTETFRGLACRDEFHPIAICGKNEVLRQRLDKLGIGTVMGWTDQMPGLLAAADVVVQNAGGLSALEAFASSVPVVSYRPIAGHGRDNTMRMEQSGVTIWAHKPHELHGVVRAAAHGGELLTNNAAGLFMSAPESHIIEPLLTTDSSPINNGATKQIRRRVMSISAAAFTLFVSTNVLANTISYRGLNIDKASSKSHFVYLTLEPGVKNISSSRLINTMLSYDIGAVISGQLAEAQPGTVKHLADYGVPILNGGWDAGSDLHLLLPNNALAPVSTILNNAVGYKVNIYLPQQQVNGVDLAWASLHHEVLIRAHTLKTLSGLKLKTGQVYEIDGSNLSSSALISEVANLEKFLHRSGLLVAPISSLGT